MSNFRPENMHEGEDIVLVTVKVGTQYLILHVTWKTAVAELVFLANEELAKQDVVDVDGIGIRARVDELLYLGVRLQHKQFLESIRTFQRQIQLELSSCVRVTISAAPGVALGVTFVELREGGALVVQSLGAGAHPQRAREKLEAVVSPGLRLMAVGGRAPDGRAPADIIAELKDTAVARQVVLAQEHVKDKYETALVTERDVEKHLELVRALFPSVSVASVDRRSLRYALESAPNFFVYCHVVAARNLTAADYGMWSDPYVRITCGDFLAKTPTVLRSTNPKFNYFALAPLAHPSQFMQFSIFDQDTITDDDHIGDVMLDLSVLPVDVFVDAWYPVQGGKGSLRLQLIMRSLYTMVAGLVTPTWPKTYTPETPLPGQRRRGAERKPALYKIQSFDSAASEESSAAASEKSSAAASSAASEEAAVGSSAAAPPTPLGPGERRVSYVLQEDLRDTVARLHQQKTRALLEARSAVGQNFGRPKHAPLQRSSAKWVSVEEAEDGGPQVRETDGERRARLSRDARRRLARMIGVDVPDAARRRGGICTSPAEFLFAALLAPAHEAERSRGGAAAGAAEMDILGPRLGALGLGGSGGGGGGGGDDALRAVASAGVYGMGADMAWLWHTPYPWAHCLAALDEVHALATDLSRLGRRAEQRAGTAPTADASGLVAGLRYPLSLSRFCASADYRAAEAAPRVPGVTCAGATRLGTYTDDSGLDNALYALAPGLAVDDAHAFGRDGSSPPLLCCGHAAAEVLAPDAGAGAGAVARLSAAGAAADGDAAAFWSGLRDAAGALPRFTLALRTADGGAWVLAMGAEAAYYDMWRRLALLVGGDRPDLRGLRGARAFRDGELRHRCAAGVLRAEPRAGGGVALRPLGGPAAPKAHPAPARAAVELDAARGALRAAPEEGGGREEVLRLADVARIEASEGPAPLASFLLQVRLGGVDLTGLLLKAERGLRRSLEDARPFVHAAIVLSSSAAQQVAAAGESAFLPKPMLLPERRGMCPYWDDTLRFGLRRDLEPLASIHFTALAREAAGGGSGGGGGGGGISFSGMMGGGAAPAAAAPVYLGECTVPLHAFGEDEAAVHVEFEQFLRRISITVHCASGLAAADANGLSDPYVELTPVAAGGNALEALAVRTGVRPKSLAPSWEQSFCFDGASGAVTRSALGAPAPMAAVPLDGVRALGGLGALCAFRLRVLDRDAGSADDPLGECTLSLQPILTGGKMPRTALALAPCAGQQARRAPGEGHGSLEVSAEVQKLRDTKFGTVFGSAALRGAASKAAAAMRVRARKAPLRLMDTWWPAFEVSNADADADADADGAAAAQAGGLLRPQYGLSLTMDHLVLDGASRPVGLEREASSGARAEGFDAAALLEVRGDGETRLVLLENERYSPFGGWGSGALLPTDPSRYTSVSGALRVPLASPEELAAPLGYVWAGAWAVDMPAGHPWTYGFDFWLHFANVAKGKMVAASADGHVRSRRWARRLAPDPRLIGRSADGAQLLARSRSLQALGDLRAFVSLRAGGALLCSVFENEVRGADGAWEDPLPPLRPRYSDEAGERRLDDLSDVAPLGGYRWAPLRGSADWQPRRGGRCDADGWTYAASFAAIAGEEAGAAPRGAQGRRRRFRRRQWLRLMRPKDAMDAEDAEEQRALDALLGDGAGGAPGGGAEEEEEEGGGGGSALLAEQGERLRRSGGAFHLALTSLRGAVLLTPTLVVLDFYDAKRAFLDGAEARGSGRLVVGPCPAEQLVNAILDRLSCAGLAGALVGIRRDLGPARLPFRSTLSFLSHSGAFRGADDAAPTRQDHMNAADEALGALALAQDEQTLLSAASKALHQRAMRDAFRDGASVHRSGMTLQELHFAALVNESAVLRACAGLQEAMGRRVRRIGAIVSEFLSLEVEVPWVENMLAAHRPPPPEEDFAERFEMAAGLSQELGRLGFVPQAEESPREATLLALLLTARAKYLVEKAMASAKEEGPPPPSPRHRRDGVDGYVDLLETALEALQRHHALGCYADHSGAGDASIGLVACEMAVAESCGSIVRLLEKDEHLKERRLRVLLANLLERLQGRCAAEARLKSALEDRPFAAISLARAAPDADASKKRASLMGAFFGGKRRGAAGAEAEAEAEGGAGGRRRRRRGGGRGRRGGRAEGGARAVRGDQPRQPDGVHRVLPEPRDGRQAAADGGEPVLVAVDGQRAGAADGERDAQLPGDGQRRAEPVRERVQQQPRVQRAEPVHEVHDAGGAVLGARVGGGLLHLPRRVGLPAAPELRALPDRQRGDVVRRVPAGVHEHLGHQHARALRRHAHGGLRGEHDRRVGPERRGRARRRQRRPADGAGQPRPRGRLRGAAGAAAAARRVAGAGARALPRRQGAAAVRGRQADALHVGAARPRERRAAQLRAGGRGVRAQLVPQPRAAGLRRVRRGHEDDGARAARRRPRHPRAAVARLPRPAARGRRGAPRLHLRHRERLPAHGRVHRDPRAGLRGRRARAERARHRERRLHPPRPPVRAPHRLARARGRGDGRRRQAVLLHERLAPRGGAGRGGAAGRRRPPRGHVHAHAARLLDRHRRRAPAGAALGARGHAARVRALQALPLRRARLLREQRRARADGGRAGGARRGAVRPLRA